MDAKNIEEYLVLLFYHQKIDDVYGDTLSNSDAKPQDLTKRRAVSDVYKRLRNNPRIAEFNTILDEHKEQLRKEREEREQQEFFQKLKEEKPEEYKKYIDKKKEREEKQNLDEYYRK